ncbi:MAG: hypothetical protein SFX74_01990 [Fimbriimonadaceae bacterium]|nr:hypothetical protein [Fimbriimonadaceae bacterium]
MNKVLPLLIVAMLFSAGCAPKPQQKTMTPRELANATLEACWNRDITSVQDYLWNVELARTGLTPASITIILREYHPEDHGWSRSGEPVTQVAGQGLLIAEQLLKHKNGKTMTISVFVSGEGPYLKIDSLSQTLVVMTQAEGLAKNQNIQVSFANELPNFSDKFEELGWKGAYTMSDNTAFKTWGEITDSARTSLSKRKS